MAGGSRSVRVRAFARDLQQRYPDVIFTAAYDSGTQWRLDWGNGPARSTVRTLADRADLAGAQLSRSYGLRAIALTAIRLATAGQFNRQTVDAYGSAPLWAVESALDDADFPERPNDDLQGRLADILVTTAKTTKDTAWTRYRAGGFTGRVPQEVGGTIAELVRTRGIGWLVAQAIDDGAELPALTVLSARYAPRTDSLHAGMAWRERAEPLPLHTAMAAALADDDLPPGAAAALLALIPELRAELARAEQAVHEAAARAGVSPTTTSPRGEPASMRPRRPEDRDTDG